MALERFPDVILVLALLGGTLPYLAQRIDIAHDYAEVYANYHWTGPPASETMRKLYADTALGWNPGALACARKLVGIDHIVFGTDYFIRSSPSMNRTIEFIDRLAMRPVEREMIYSGTASRILQIG